MSASQPSTHDLRRGDSLLSARAKEAGRSLLRPVVDLAVRLRLTPNTVTVIGFLVVAVASTLVATGNLLAGAALLVGGSLLDAVDGALARATGGATLFGGFLDSTLDRAAEAILYAGVGAYYLASSPDPTWPILLGFAALTTSFLVSYTRARAEAAGFGAEVGVAPRLERLVILIGGIGLTGLGWEIGIIGALILVTALAVTTTIQRIWHVYQQAAALIASAEMSSARESNERG